MRDDGNIIVIPDVHQDFRFLKNVLESNDLNNVDRLLFLGDFFDSKHFQYTSPHALKQTLDIVAELVQRYRDRVVVLMGNHDVKYYYSCKFLQTPVRIKSMVIDYYGLPDRELLRIANSDKYDAVWEQVRMCHHENGFLFSHAGVSTDFWDLNSSIDENVETLNALIGNPVVEDFVIHPAFRAGKARGGNDTKGGPLWLDWYAEFEDELGIPQVVGHTVGAEARKSGSCYCIDAKQSCYAVVSNGKVEIHNVKTEGFSN